MHRRAPLFRRLDEVLLPGGQLSGSGSTFLIDNRSNAATRVVNEALKAGATAAFSASEKAIVLEGSADTARAIA